MHDPGPTKAFYAMGCFAMIAGVGAAVAVAVALIPGVTNMLQQVEVPGERVLTLTETGTYTVFHEHQSTIDGKVYSTAPGGLGGLEITIRPAAGGAPLPVTAPTANMTYSFPGRAGTALVEFEVAAPGEYIVGARYPGGVGTPSVVAVGRGFMRRVATVAVTSVLLCLGGIALGLVAILVTYSRRRSARLADPNRAGFHAPYPSGPPPRI